MDWYSSKNFCEAQGKSMLSLSDLNCPYTPHEYSISYKVGYCCATAGNNIMSECNNNYSLPIRRPTIEAYFWTTDSATSLGGGRALVVYLNTGRVTYCDFIPPYYFFYALCR